MVEVLLRNVEEADLPIFFDQQLDGEANRMAAFTAADPTDRVAFSAHWTKILADDTVRIRTVVVKGQVVGQVAQFDRFGNPEVTYWIGKEHWGQGIATEALREFLRIFSARPLYARAAKDNVGSLRVLQKCGFAVSEYAKAFAHARGEVVDEAVLVLA